MKDKNDTPDKNEKKSLKQRKREAERLERCKWGHVKDQGERY